MLRCEVPVYQGRCLRVESPPLSSCYALLYPPSRVHQEWSTLRLVTPFHLWGQGCGFLWEAGWARAPASSAAAVSVTSLAHFSLGFILFLSVSPLGRLAHFWFKHLRP